MCWIEYSIHTGEDEPAFNKETDELQTSRPLSIIGCKSLCILRNMMQ